MRLRELRQLLATNLTDLEVKIIEAPGTIIGGQAAVRISNWSRLANAIESVRATGLFDDEIGAALSTNAAGSGGRYALVPGDANTFSVHLTDLRRVIKRTIRILDGVVPDLQGAAGFAVRLPVGDDLRDVVGSVDALVRLNDAVRILTGRQLAFGGVDVGSFWVNLIAVGTVAGTVVGTAVVQTLVEEATKALLKVAKEHALGAWRRRQAVRNAEKAGLPIPDADAKLKQLSEEDVRKRVEDIARQMKPNMNEEEKGRVGLALKEMSALFEGGGEVKGLITRGDDGTEREPVLQEPLRLPDGSEPPPKLLTRGTADDPPDSEEPPEQKLDV